VRFISDDMPFACSSIWSPILSFISLTKVLPSLMSVMSPEDWHSQPLRWCLLVKPQFEAGRVEVSRGKGVITDPGIHAETIQTVQECVESLGGSVSWASWNHPSKGQKGTPNS
jgi:23S rRNA (cytidine1920-2'-O)/16S rRNA (cytidine1409-2'-O)-methyltransferase